MATATPAASNGFKPSKLALLFPGQGAQSSGMGKGLFDRSNAARDVYKTADETLGFSVSELCFNGSNEELEDTANTQPAIVTTSLAYLADLRERLQETGRRLAPSFVAGHSLGQFTAAIAAGTLALTDGLQLVMERGRIMSEWARNRPGGMVTVLGMNDKQIRDVCKEVAPDGSVGVAVYNGAGHTVISGDLGPLDKAMELAKERGGRVLRLPIGVPGHTPLMRDAAAKLAKFIEAAPFHDPDPPLVSNMTGRLLTRAEDVREELSDQICKAVDWARCVITMANEGTGVFLEVGPGLALSKMVRRVTEDTQTIGADAITDEQLLDLPSAPINDELPAAVEAAR
jgi:[acyl-carrier-protein] S-malonyltransferase